MINRIRTIWGPPTPGFFCVSFSIALWKFRWLMEAIEWLITRIGTLADILAFPDNIEYVLAEFPVAIPIWGIICSDAIIRNAIIAFFDYYRFRCLPYLQLWIGENNNIALPTKNKKRSKNKKRKNRKSKRNK